MVNHVAASRQMEGEQSEESASSVLIDSTTEKS